MALRRSNPGDYLLSGLIRCGRCRRAYVGMSARGNGRTYHCYACTGRQKLGRAGCDGERIPRDKLEAAVLKQLALLYRDGALSRSALDEAAKQQADRPQLEKRRRSLAEEIRRAERALDRYYRASEDGDLDSGRFQTRVSAPETRLDALREQHAELARHLALEADTGPNTADLEAVADQLERTIAEADPKQAKALLRLQIKDLRLNGRSEILPTYRVVTPEVCALPSSVGGAGLDLRPPACEGRSAAPHPRPPLPQTAWLSRIRRPSAQRLPVFARLSVPDSFQDAPAHDLDSNRTSASSANSRLAYQGKRTSSSPTPSE